MLPLTDSHRLSIPYTTCHPCSCSALTQDQTQTIGPISEALLDVVPARLPSDIFPHVAPMLPAADVLTFALHPHSFFLTSKPLLTLFLSPEKSVNPNLHPIDMILFPPLRRSELNDPALGLCAPSPLYSSQPVSITGSPGESRCLCAVEERERSAQRDSCLIPGSSGI